ncbi:MAG: hypothetical protein LBI13_08825 [Streptococcaceae bacterium]|jgi:hypothetical protein|nr:hypothetical protein [Streptococcaceae bacterium]
MSSKRLVDFLEIEEDNLVISDMPADKTQIGILHTAGLDFITYSEDPYNKDFDLSQSERREWEKTNPLKEGWIVVKQSNLLVALFPFLSSKIWRTAYVLPNDFLEESVTKSGGLPIGTGFGIAVALIILSQVQRFTAFTVNFSKSDLPSWNKFVFTFGLLLLGFLFWFLLMYGFWRVGSRFTYKEIQDKIKTGKKVQIRGGGKAKNRTALIAWLIAVIGLMIQAVIEKNSLITPLSDSMFVFGIAIIVGCLVGMMTLENFDEMEIKDE